MPTTTRGYPYPAGADAADPPADIQAAVAAIDSDISASLPNLAITSFGDIGSLVSGAYTAVDVNTSNSALVVVVKPKVTVTPTKFVWWCTTQSGNYDVALISASSRARLWSSGSTACPAAGQVSVNIAAGPTLNAGTTYGMVFAADNTTLKLAGCPVLVTGMGTLYDGVIGIGTVSASFPIPATLSAWSAAVNFPGMAIRA